ncbi:hypothetical protein MMC25_008271 [Agyrium rufum]|nr:hypothetical protein [Agyrium rufum]
MLRLPASKIALTQKDLTWHKDRHEIRLTQPVEPKVPPLNIKQSRASFVGSSIGEFPLPPSHQALVAEDDLSIVSPHPVPKGSRAFWDNVRAETTSGRLLEYDVADLAKYLETIRDRQEIIHTAPSHAWRAPINTSWESYSDVDETYSGAGGIDEADAGSSSTTSSDDSKKTQIENNYLPETRETTSAAPSETHATKHRFSFLGFPRKSHKESRNANFNQLEARFPNQIDLDGASEAARLSDLSAHHGDDCSARAAELEYLPPISPGLMEKTCRTASTLEHHGLEPDVDHVHGLSLDQHEVEGAANTSSKLVTRNPHTAHIRSHSGGLPRSRLYISHAAISSSPEKRSATPNAIGDTSPGDLEPPPSLLRLPPRRPPRAKLLPPIYPLPARPKLPCNVANHVHSSPSEPYASNSTKHHSDVPTSSTESPNRFDIGSSPPSLPRSSPDPLSTSPLNDQTPRHNNSSPETSYIPVTSTRNPSYRLFPATTSTPPLPPLPFSATPRIASLSLGSTQSISSSPLRPPTTPQRTSTPPNPTHIPQAQSTILPSSSRSSRHPNQTPASLRVHFRNQAGPSSHSSSPSHSASAPSTPSPTRISTPYPYPDLRPRRRIPVYNDALPSSSQPQTPIGLPRHGIPPLESGVLPVGARTAPPAMMRVRRVAARDAAEGGSPVRRGAIVGGVEAREVGRGRGEGIGGEIRGVGGNEWVGVGERSVWVGEGERDTGIGDRGQENWEGLVQE